MVTFEGIYGSMLKREAMGLISFASVAEKFACTNCSKYSNFAVHMG
jgi:hypothetical protein